MLPLPVQGAARSSNFWASPKVTRDPCELMESGAVAGGLQRSIRRCCGVLSRFRGYQVASASRHGCGNPVLPQFRERRTGVLGCPASRLVRVTLTRKEGRRVCIGFIRVADLLRAGRGIGRLLCVGRGIDGSASQRLRQRPPRIWLANDLHHHPLGRQPCQGGPQLDRDRERRRVVGRQPLGPHGVLGNLAGGQGLSGLPQCSKAKAHLLPLPEEQSSARWADGADQLGIGSRCE